MNANFVHFPANLGIHVLKDQVAVLCSLLLLLQWTKYTSMSLLHAMKSPYNQSFFLLINILQALEPQLFVQKHIGNIIEKVLFINCHF